MRTVLGAVVLVVLVVGVERALPGQQWKTKDGPVVGTWQGGFDLRRGRFVRMAAGDAQTWEFDGVAWRQRQHPAPPFGAPATRTRCAVTYDSDNARLLLFGGFINSTIGDFWQWDGQAWSQISTIAGPSRRAGAVMAYDSLRHLVVLFGGEEPIGTPLADTWTYDVVAGQWSLGAARSGWTSADRLAFDAARGLTVGCFANGTSTFDGATWTQRSGVGALPGMGLAYDPVRQVVVGAADRLLREWNGTSWASTTMPSLALAAAQMWYDPSIGGVVISDQQRPGELVTWNGIALGQRSLQPFSSSRYAFIDPVRGKVVVFGGIDGPAPANTTTTHDGIHWVRANPATSPGPRHSGASAFDTVRNVGLVFGGNSGSGVLGDLWSWNGTTWALVSATGPAAAMMSALAFDSARGRAVLFGGITASGLTRATWEWDGLQWTQAQPAQSPPIGLGAMAYDPVRQRTVFFASLTTPKETWEWDGVNWTRVNTPSAPTLSGLATMTFDPSRNRMMLVYPTSAGGIWEYDGANWTPSLLPAPPMETVGTLMWNSMRSRLDVIQGSGLWELTSAPPDIVEYGTPCGTPPALLMSHDTPVIGNASFAFDAATAPSAACLFGVSSSSANVALGNGGCTLLVGSLDFSGIAIADGRGLARWSVPVPNVAALVGVQVFAQAGALLGSGAIVTTQGLQVRVGD